MGSDLPYDICLHIVKYLEPSALGKLISVNRAFFDIVLEMRYRDVRSWKIGQNIGRLRDPYIASRVHILRLSIEEPPKSWTLHPLRLFKRITNMPQRAAAQLGIINPSRDSFLDDTGDPEDLPDYTFGTSTSLRSFERNPWSNLPPNAAWVTIPIAWPMLSSSLQALMLRLSPEAIDHLIPPTIVFPKLETLSIEIVCHDYLLKIQHETIANYRRVVSTRLLPFIKHHTSTLTSLALTRFGHPLLDSSLILGMGYFPRLKKLKLDGFKDPECVGHMWNVLGLHAKGLEEICIQIYLQVNLPWYEGPPFARHPLFELHCPITDLGYLGSIACHLTSLKLLGKIYRYPEVCDVISVLEGHTRIHDLSMKLDFVSPQVIDLFAEKMSHLQFLCLRVGFCGVVGDTSIGTETRREVFCEAMARRKYPDWKLPKFYLVVQFRGNIPHVCKEALLRVLPQIQVRLEPLW